MTADVAHPASVANTTAQNKILFWGCFIALVTTAFGFIARVFLVNTWGDEFGLDGAQRGRLMGIGIWPFAVSIIGFSLVIDRVGYKLSMVIAFLGHIIWAIMGVSAYFVAHPATGEGNKPLAFQLLYWGSLILALANGTVEAFINPVVATMFNKDKTKWLNILHAGWPGGLVLAGIVTIFLEPQLIVKIDETTTKHMWWVTVGIIAVPAVIYFLILLSCRFPQQERVASGVSFRDMLSEFGILGAMVVGFLVALQLMDFFGTNGRVEPWQLYLFIGIGAAIVVGFGLYTQSVGRFLMFFLILIMMPLATTEIGTDGWITGIMEGIAKSYKFHAGWVLVYTSAIMMILRFFFAGPIVHKLSPLPLLAVSACLAIVGLLTLSFTEGIMIFAAATLYALGKSFFWPTMLGVVSEQMPKGGALTLNAIAGIGMLAVGTLGSTYIGTLTESHEIAAIIADKKITEAIPGLVKDNKLTVVENRQIYEIISYEAISTTKLDDLVKAIPDAAKRKSTEEQVKETINRSKQGALANMIVFPAIMLVGYLILIGYFKARGGYKAVHLGDGSH